MSALSATLRVIGPAWSIVTSMLMMPVYGTSPWVGFIPTMPQNAPGMRIEPP
jgi:hypothetical protein